jgi:hypothetical protein
MVDSETAETTRLVVACALALFVPLLIPLVTRRVLTFNDLGDLHLPLRYLYRKALQAGDSPLWSPAFYSGVYLYGEGQTGMAHPFHLLLYRFLPLDVAFNIEMISSYAVAVAGMRLLLPRLGLTTEAAWFGGMLFAFSGFNLAHLIHPNAIAVVAHMPWVLLTAHVLCTSWNRRACAMAFGGIALLIASECLIGFPQCVWMTFLAVSCFSLWLAIVHLAPVRLALVALAMGCGVLVGAVQLLPSLDTLNGSVRAAPTVDFRLSFSLPILNVLQLWSPHAFTFAPYGTEDPAVRQFMGGESVYSGAFCTAALVWVAVRWRTLRHRALAVALLAFAALTLVLAFGRDGRIYVWLVSLPGLNTLRAPARHLVLFHLALSAVAAVAFDDLLVMMRRRETLGIGRLWPFAVLVVLSAVTTGGATLLARSAWASAHGVGLAGGFAPVAWSIAIVTMAVLLALIARGGYRLVPLLVVITAADLGTWGYSFTLGPHSMERLADVVAAAPVPPQARAGELFEQRATGSGPPENLGAMRDLRLISGNIGLVPAVSLGFDGVALRVAGASWRPEGDGWARIPDTMPRARLVASVQRTENPHADVRRIDIERVALTDQAIDGIGGVPGTARVTVDRPGHIVVDTSAPSRQVLVVTERFHEGWKARRDGVDVPVLRLYGDYIGSVVDAGKHQVAFTFEPQSLRDGLRYMWIGLALTAAVMAAVWIVPAWPRRTRRDD